MDPVTAFSIACGTIQVVDFGIKVAYKVYTIVQSSSGTLKENEELETATVTLQGLMDALKAQSDSIPPYQTTRVIQNPGDIGISRSTAQEVRQLASQCGEIAQELIDLLNNIKVDPKKYRSTTSRTLKAVKAYSKSRKISKLESRLEEYQKRLERHIIVELRGTSQALLRGTTQGFEDLQAEHKIIVEAIANNESNIAKLIEVANAQTQHLITAEGERVRGEIAIVGKRLDNAEYKQKLELFIESFAFADMFYREDRMSQQPAAPRTFRWLFDKDYDTKRPYDSFMDWLEGDQTIYWFCGRAGSGKSTLMSFIWDHPDSKKDEYLQKWCPDGNLTTAAVFFWSQGSELQKSSRGLLRSLVYQLIRRDESRARRIMELWSASKDPHQEWTEARLMSILQSVLDEPDIRACFFIDGLDEYGDGSVVANNNLLRLILDLTAHGRGRLKCCLSSRPLRPFELGLESYPKLMLHKLTRPDITNFVTDSLGESTEDYLIEDIVEKANGIFLWAFFAVKSLHTAQINGDTSDQIQKRLDKLPPELNDLYSHMLLQIDRVYWKEAALYFALAIVYSSKHLSVVHYVMASLDNYFEELMLPWTDKRLGALRRDCQNMEVWLKVRTAGLLEVEIVRLGYSCETYGDDLSENDLNADKTVNDNLSERRFVEGETADFPSTRLSQTELETYQGLLELYGDTQLTSKSQAILNGSSAKGAIQHSLVHRRVVAIHRSVAEFLECEKQNKLLQLCSKGKALLHSVQAHLVLLTVHHKLGSEIVNDVDSILYYLMDSARQAESYTKQPSRVYIDRLQSVLKAVRGPGWPANDPDQDATTFLGFAASCGLGLYVQDVLKNDLRTRNENRQLLLNEVLWCALDFWLGGGFPMSELGNKEQCELIKFLLNEHADPNHAAQRKVYAGNMTAWEAYLGQVVELLRRSSLDNCTDLTISEVRDLLESFVSHGADSHQELFYSLTPWGPVGRDGEFECQLRANAVFVLERFGLPCDPSQSRAVMETVSWLPQSREIEIRADYRPTPQGSAMLLEAFVAFWDLRSSRPEQLTARNECYRRCLEVRRSAHDPDYKKPPLAEYYPGDPKPTPEEEDGLDNYLDESSRL